jgi:glycine/D-amino acid oxidase-like deaminating enzyme
VLDREPIGWGASSRNGGALSGAGSLSRAKTDPGLLAALVEEAEASFDDFEALIGRENLACHFKRTGRFIGAHSASAMDTLKRRAEALNASHLYPHNRDTAEILPRDRVGEELATPRYHGGLVLQRAGALHPGLYVQELARAAASHGAALHGGVAVQSYARQGDAIIVETSAGTLRAKHLVIATNGYTGEATPWHRRRLIPVASYMIATEELGEERVEAVMPKLRVYGDTKKVLYYFRPSPDHRRILFGGRASFGRSATRAAGARLLAFLTHLLPDLAGTRITHAWQGNVAFTFDFMPHIGEHDGVHFALGCNGSGVVTMTHLGRQVAARLLGGPNRASAFARIDAPTQRGYTGKPWFLPIVGAVYRLRDRLDGWREPGWP